MKAFLVVASLLTFAVTPALAEEFWVAQDPATKKCDIVSEKPDGRYNNHVIGPGSNSVHTRSSGVIRKKHQPSNTCSAGSADGDVCHVVYLYRSDRSR